MSVDWLDKLALDPSRTDGSGERTFRLALFTQMLAACVHDTKLLRTMGLRLLVLCARVLPGSVGKVTAAMRKEMRASESTAFAMMRVKADEVDLEERMRVVDLLLGQHRHEDQDPKKLGRRVTLLAYAFCRESEVRAALPSFEYIGEYIWGLKAQNKRSAVCAAMHKAVIEMVERGQLKERDAATLTDLWFAKKQVTKAKYVIAQMGNRNRRKRLEVVSMNAEEDLPESRRREIAEEHHERIDGVPREAMRAQFRGMTAAQVTAHLQKLHEAAEARRLAQL